MKESCEPIKKLKRLEKEISEIKKDAKENKKDLNKDLDPVYWQEVAIINTMDHLLKIIKEK